MRRTVALAVSLVLVAGACSGDDDDVASPTTTRPPTTATTAATTTLPDLPCDGIGPAPSGGEVTWLQGGRVWAATSRSDVRCLVRADDASSIAWGGTADRVLVGKQTIVLEDGPHDIGAPDELIGWSRPSGRALLAVDPVGALRKYSVDGAPPLDLSFPLDAQETLYHPSGVAIVAIVSLDDRPNLLMTTNLGENARWLIDNETANEIHSLAFDGNGGLYFVADHGDHQHVHALDLQTNQLATLYQAPADVPLGPIAVSPFDSQIAVGRGDCAEPIWGGQASELLGVSGEPIGWLPDGQLVTMQHEHGCDGPGDVFIGGDGTPIARGVDAAAVRAVLPPPPAPPADIDEAAPA